MNIYIYMYTYVAGTIRGYVNISNVFVVRTIFRCRIVAMQHTKNFQSCHNPLAIH